MTDATSKPKERRPINTRSFGLNAPPKNLPFPPAYANLTAIELLTFLPNCIKCSDVIYRFVSNGGTRHVFWAIVNTQRDLEVEWNANSCGVQIYKAMRGAGYEDWTIKIHDKWHAAKRATWDEQNLDVSGLQAPDQLNRGHRPANDVSFGDLALGVRRMPEGEDALDLTRMVRYCIQNPNEKWRYPKDYVELLDLIGGPAQTHNGHTDRAAFGRWERITPPPPRPKAASASVDTIAVVTDAKTEQKRKRAGSVRGNTGMTEDTPARGSTPRLVRQIKTRRTGKLRATAYGSGDSDTMNIEDEAVGSKIYIRQPPLHVEPPHDTPEPPDVAIESIFLTEGWVGETDLFSAYAFGSHRTLPPYRMLHRMRLPDSGDVSGWAENLRWMFEQKACFLHTYRTVGWNESSEHMEMIAQIRKEQMWASDELLDHLMETQGE
ncbi:hypothetical protein P153DRAFT_424191 [Dothidotthia symphoricarpi CBS 119687]|uniref:Uncharacterized protein n=1 Tax=Dothidotthia symphoricarpi CBS 119687 TaxID=1392245 RepID=A0A6A6AA56_9PLEO|nr:uncharacterized protein P153DRAFT_424191 [Dothidotthia symphoricarpi CBS 119687]KAF2127561.1 hypothetical protein P153DRAFT_424191 [Dothidotthia symphoricarpi CBS 119687]